MEIKDTDLIVWHGIKPLYRLNEMLLIRQKCVDRLPDIKLQHELKLQIYDWIAEETDHAILKEFSTWLTNIEFTLQELWNFPSNQNYHKFWETPKCQCAKMDNIDAYPTGYYSVNMGCPLHGK